MNEKSEAKPKSTVGKDAVELLTEDHKAVKKLFQQYEKLAKNKADSKERSALAKTICDELTVHAQIEEEIFYPALRKAFDVADLLDEATVEHGSVKDLIGQIQSSSKKDGLYDAKVKVLGEYVDHHVKEEQDEIFPKAKKMKVDLDKLGEQLAARKAELTSKPSKRTSDV